MNILLAINDSSTLSMLKLHCERQKWSVWTASNVEAAKEMFSRNIKIEVVVADVNLTPTDIFDFMSDGAVQQSCCSVLGICGSVRPYQQRKLIEMGAGLLLKPFTSTELFSEIKNLLRLKSEAKERYNRDLKKAMGIEND